VALKIVDLFMLKKFGIGDFGLALSKTNFILEQFGFRSKFVK
jgi:hypothetical protein